MTEVIEELEHVLKVVENDIEYYERKLKVNPTTISRAFEKGFYKGGKAALIDVKSYLEKEIQRTKITNKF